MEVAMRIYPWLPLNVLQRRREGNVKPRRSGTIKGIPAGGLSSTGKSSLHNDDMTVVMSNLSKKIKSRRVVAPKIATLPDNNPACLVQDPSHLPVHHKKEDGDTYEEGRDDIMIMSSINAVDIHRMSWLPAANVQAEPVDVPQDDDPDAIRAQVDTGTHVKCTDQQYMLQGY